MKITRLYLKNFAHIYSGLGKYEIELDLSNSDKIINVIIGKMGSCKTVILGHLQPFHSFGTLDVRNQDNIILEGEDGIKIIEYKDRNDYYTITHNYIWNKNSHSVKSYIEKNGNELNPNGNQSSFKTIIELEFGIEQSFLRLLRLGTNVSNVINMKSTERKAFIASLLRDAEIYQIFHKKLTDKMKVINAQTSVLSNKLHLIGVDKENELMQELEYDSESISDLSKEEDKIKTKIYEIKGSLKSILGDMDLNEYLSLYDELERQREELENEIHSLKIIIEKYNSYPPITEITKIIGGLDQKQVTNSERINQLSEYHKEVTTELSKLLDRKKINSNDDQLSSLKDIFKELTEKLESYKAELKFFKCDYNASFITRLIGDLNTINILIEEISQYNIELIKKIYNSDSSIIRWSKGQIDMLNGKKINMQKRMNNIRFSENYVCTQTMFLPPFCPTKECPYYKTHPINILKESIKDENSELDLMNAQLDQIDAQIAIYQDYPIVYSKMTTLKELWKKSKPILQKLKALKSDSLLLVLTNFQFRKWYDYDELTRCVELCEKREKFYELTEQLNEVKNEISMMELETDFSLDEKITYLEKEIDNIVTEITELEISNKSILEQIKSNNEIYMELSQLSIYENQLREREDSYKKIIDELSKLKKHEDEIKDYQSILKSLEAKDIEFTYKLKELAKKVESTKAVLNDIAYTKKEFEKVLQDKEYLKYIIDAVSSKEGIPLILVQMFTNNCKDIINELVSDVFGDIIEILDFKITETDFKIPYAVNGVKVEDIEKASQGQQTIISIALSFALIRDVLFKYNIMLLDEVDGPLYKHDRNKFISILFKQLQAINAEQVFLISHNNTFDGYPVNVIMTTDELVDENSLTSVMRV